jgi:WbqC-like protein family
MTLVAIHQPNFLPWLGFFDKLAKADRFVILDTVALQLTGGNYTNRVRLLINGTASWVSVPVKRGRSARERIDIAKVAEVAGWRRTLKLSIQQSYSKAPYFGDTLPIIERVLDAETDSLCEMNMIGILAIAEALNLDTRKILRSSELACEGQGTELLANLVETVGGNAYLTGHGAGGYQDDAVFGQRGISVQYQRYQVPPYAQYRASEFVSGLSAIDALMNCGGAAATLIGRSP